jgi:hypothetical protein
MPDFHSGIKGQNRDIFTGFYKNFQSLSDDEKQAIFDERKRLMDITL